MFSVVIPLYNKELSIANTIQSVLDQTYQDFEIVVVNDGSTDRSAEIVEQINDPRIRLVHQKNQGVSAARNTGIKEAKREWIAFLDGDDLWTENHLEEASKMIGKYPNQYLYATSYKYSTGRVIVNEEAPSYIYMVDNFFLDFINTKQIIWTGTIIAYREAFNRAGFFDPELALGEDLDMWVRIAKVKPTLIRSKKITAIYRTEAENRSDKRKYNMSKSFLKQIDFKSMESKEEIQFYKFWIIHRIKIFIVHKDFKALFFLLRKYGINLLIK